VWNARSTVLGKDSRICGLSARVLKYFQKATLCFSMVDVLKSYWAIAEVLEFPGHLNQNQCPIFGNEVFPLLQEAGFETKSVEHHRLMHCRLVLKDLMVRVYPFLNRYMLRSEDESLMKSMSFP
jgi:hypothetical protein